MATISRFKAVCTVGKLKFTGFIAWMMWLVVHLAYLTGFKNRVTAVLRWAISFIGRDRSERTTTMQQVFGRQALEKVDGGVTGLVSDPGEMDAYLAKRRAELEAQAAEEARLTDANQRGVAAG
jgi:NADH dehydrogenase